MHKYQPSNSQCHMYNTESYIGSLDAAFLDVCKVSSDAFRPTMVPTGVYASKDLFPMLFYISLDDFVHRECLIFLQGVMFLIQDFQFNFYWFLGFKKITFFLLNFELRFYLTLYFNILQFYPQILCEAYFNFWP